MVAASWRIAFAPDQVRVHLGLPDDVEVTGVEWNPGEGCVDVAVRKVPEAPIVRSLTAARPATL